MTSKIFTWPILKTFRLSRRIFIVQAKKLIDSFALGKVDAIISNAKHDMAESLTTYGMKQNIRKLFDNLRDLLDNAIEMTNETRRPGESHTQKI